MDFKEIVNPIILLFVSECFKSYFMLFQAEGNCAHVCVCLKLGNVTRAWRSAMIYNSCDKTTHTSSFVFYHSSTDNTSASKSSGHGDYDSKNQTDTLQRCLQSRSDVQCSVFVFSSIFIWGGFKAWFFIHFTFLFRSDSSSVFVNFIYCSIFIFKFWDLWNFRVHLKHLSFLRCESLHSADIAAKKPASLSIQLLSFLTSLIVPLL